MIIHYNNLNEWQKTVAARKWKRTHCSIFSRTAIWYWNDWNYQFSKAVSVFQGDTKSLKHQGKDLSHISLSLGQILAFRKLSAFSLTHPLTVILIIILFHLAIVTNNYWKPETQGWATRQGRDFPQRIKLCRKLRNFSACNSLN